MHTISIQNPHTRTMNQQPNQRKKRGVNVFHQTVRRMFVVKLKTALLSAATLHKSTIFARIFPHFFLNAAEYFSRNAFDSFFFRFSHLLTITHNIGNSFQHFSISVDEINWNTMNVNKYLWWQMNREPSPLMERRREREREQKLREEKKHIWIVRKQLFVIWNMIDEMFCGIVLNGWRMANKITFKMWPIVHLKILILLFKSFLTICHTCNRRSTQKDEPSLWNDPKL